MKPLVEKISKENLKKSLPEIQVGCTVKIVLKIVEEGKTRPQAYTGTVIAIKGRDNNYRMIVRRVSGNIAIERIIFLHSPMVTSIEVLKKGKVRRAKLYYLRDKTGKQARLEEID